jgi:Asp-tRNA(Asn)/Glu-tRNA(Gln) amidotransferase B subunit
LQLLHDPEQLDNFCAAAIEARPDATQAWRKGRLQAVDALLGEAMIRSRGKAAPAKLRTRLLAMLEARPA